MTYSPKWTRLPVSIGELLKEYQTTTATSYSLAARYGMEQRHISRILHDNMNPNTRKELEGEKKSMAAKRKWAERKKAI